MIAGDSLTGWDGAGIQAQGLLPRNEGNLEGGNMRLVERAVGTVPRMKEYKQVARVPRMEEVHFRSHTITWAWTFELGIERVVWVAGDVARGWCLLGVHKVLGLICRVPLRKII